MSLKARLNRHLFPIGIYTLASLLILAICFYLTSASVNSWDTLEHYQQSRWLLHFLGLLPSGADAPTPSSIVQFYGPFWEIILGIFTEHVFSFLREPGWVRNAINLFSYPLFLIFLFRMLRASKIPPSSTALILSLIFGLIRLGGHAITNSKDYPLATAFLLITFFQWRWVEEQLRKPAEQRFGFGSLAVLGSVSIIPFLIRPPMLIHFAAAALIAPICVWITQRKLSWKGFFIPLAFGTAWCFLLYPPFRENPLEGPLNSISAFTHFEIGKDFLVRYFGFEHAAADLPGWYSLIWPVVSFHPLVFILVIAGLILAFCKPRAPRFSLTAWLLLFGSIAWIGVIVSHPILYNEDRHLLFLYPPFVCVAGMALANRLSERTRYALAAVITACAIFSYISWGRYSYAYKSPLIGDRSPARFSGDYWGLCVPLAIQALPDHVPPGAPVFLSVPAGIVLLEDQRLKESLLHADPRFQGYRFIFNPADLKGLQKFYLINFNENSRSELTMNDVRQGKATLLWENTMPPDARDCVLVSYP